MIIKVGRMAKLLLSRVVALPTESGYETMHDPTYHYY